MPKHVFPCVLVFLAVLTLAAPRAGETLSPPPRLLEDLSRRHLPEGITLYAKDWFRLSQWHYFDPATPGGDPDYGYVSNRFRFGLKAKRRQWGANIGFQYVKQAFLPDGASGTPGGALGLGATYFAQNGRTTDPDSLYLKFLNFSLYDIAGSGLDLTLGRMGYGSGVETLSGVKKIDWLKKTRIDARLIGGFGWSLYQRSFDGVKAGWDHGPGHLSLAWLRPTQGGFEGDAGEEITDINVTAAAYTFKPGRVLPGAELQIFHYYYDDQRDIPARSDNSGLTATGQDMAIHSLGGHVAGSYALGAGIMDILLWGVCQGGDWFEQSHDAHGVAAELGYQWPQLPWKPWLRAGVFRGSGDGDAADDSHGTFFQMLPTVRKYAFTTAYNLMNNTDFFLQALLAPTPELSLRGDVHFVRLSESADLWWGGAGATQANGLASGYSGRSSGGNTKLGTTLELTAKYQLTEAIGLHGFYSHIFGSDVVVANFSDDADFDFFFLETTLSF
jgi:hypothetical protein